MRMKKFINDPKNLVAELLEGMVLAFPDKVQLTSRNILARAAPGPIVEVNRAVAHGRAYGPSVGLAVLEQVDADSLGDSPLLPSVRGDLLERAGLHAPACEAFTEAASRTANGGERTVLQHRADWNRSPGSDPDGPPHPTRA